jgi:uncharacterized Zn-binding protein involved in type VI secretion
MTSHGTPLGPGPGSPTVLIEGQPAWRAHVDLHVCPLSDGTHPHIGGSVAMASATVFIAGQPAARQSDSVVEVQGPNPIVSGARTVIIG